MPPIPSTFPQELCRDIISYIGHDHDSGTRALLNAAQCSWALRHEAQRVLFRHPFVFLWQDSDKPDSPRFSISRSHEGFLEAILLAPRRLGPLVRSYNQSQISYNRKEPGLVERMWQAEDWREQTGHMYELTKKSLPHMTNLKSLYFATAAYLPASPDILIQCNFQLEIMEWRHSRKKFTVARLLLPQQQRLRHLDATEWDAGEVGEEHISMNLASIAGNLKDLAALATGRKIVALEYYKLGKPSRGRPTRPAKVRCPRADEALRNLRYLCVATYKIYLRLLGDSKPADVFPNLLFLNLSLWSFREITTYTLLPPKLQILVLGSQTNVDLHIPSEDIAFSALTAVPQLQFIDVETPRQKSTAVIVHRYHKNLGGDYASSVADNGIPVKLTRETLAFARGWGDDWWRERAASLGWIEGTQDMSYRYTTRCETVEPRTAI